MVVVLVVLVPLGRLPLAPVGPVQRVGRLDGDVSGEKDHSHDGAQREHGAEGVPGLLVENVSEAWTNGEPFFNKVLKFNITFASWSRRTLEY